MTERRPDEHWVGAYVQRRWRKVAGLCLAVAGLVSCGGGDVFTARPTAPATSSAPSSPSGSSEAPSQPTATATVTETVTASPSPTEVIETTSIEKSLAPDRLSEGEYEEYLRRANDAVLRALESIPPTDEVESAGEDAPFNGAIGFAEFQRTYEDGDRSVVQSLAMETGNSGLVVRLTSTEVCLQGNEPVGCDEERDIVSELWFGGAVPAGEAFTPAELREAMLTGSAVFWGGRITVSGHDGTYQVSVTVSESGELVLHEGGGETAQKALGEVLKFGGYGRS